MEVTQTVHSQISDYFDYQAMFDNCPSIMGIVELKGNDILHLKGNKEAQKFFGASAIDMQTKSALERNIPPEIVNLWIKNYLRSKAEGSPVKFQYWQGDNFLSVEVNYFYNSKRKNLFTYIIQNLTDDKRTLESLSNQKLRLSIDLKNKQEELAKIEHRSQALFESAAAGIAEIGGNGSFVRVNKKFCELIGYSEEETRKLTFQKITHPDDLDLDVEQTAKLFAGVINHFSLDKRYIKKDGSIVWIHLTASLVETPSSSASKYAIAVVQDITEKKQLEEKLLESSRKIEVITQTIPNFIWTCTPDGNATYFNQSWYKYTGQTTEESFGSGWKDAIHPQDIDHTFSLWKKSLEAGEILSNQLRLKDIQGNYKWFLAECVPLKNSEGEIVQWFGSSADIDDQKKAQKTIEDAVLLRDEFLLMASHELKTPITSLKMHLQMLQSKMKRVDSDSLASQLTAPQTLEFIDIAHRQANNLAHLVENLLDISRVKLGKMGFAFERTNMSQFLNDALYSFEATTNRAVCKIEYNLEANIFGLVDKIKIEQVVLNLLMNSLKYAPGSTINISLQCDNERPEYMLLKFSDDGPGIPLSRRKAIFDKFTRGYGHNNVSGLGLGLYISKKIIENHSGTIQLDEEDKGVTFNIHIPLTDA